MSYKEIIYQSSDQNQEQEPGPAADVWDNFRLILDFPLDHELLTEL